jgi:hypothetical protein
MLQIDPALASAPGAIERGGAAVVAVRNLKLPGVLRTAEMDAEDARVWVIAATPPTVTLSELFARAVELDPASAVFLAPTLSDAESSARIWLAHCALTEQAGGDSAGSAALMRSACSRRLGARRRPGVRTPPAGRDRRKPPVPRAARRR